MPATSLLISHHEMQAAQERGDVRPLCRNIPELCKWYGQWWLLSAEGWLRVTDSHLAGRLDRIKTRLDVAEEADACGGVRHANDTTGPGDRNEREKEIWPAW